MHDKENKKNGRVDLNVIHDLPSDVPPRPADTPCCGPPAIEVSEPEEIGDAPWIVDRISTPAGSVPIAATTLTAADRLATWKVRWGIGRMRYRVVPGLYGVGRPTVQSPVLVSANYKMSFDHLRSNLSGRDAWILVLDTLAVNVWCSAGKGTFGTAELAARIRRGDREALEKLVVANLRFVVSVSRNYQNQGLPLSDLINEGNLGLIRAARRFDERKNFRFISYAVWWIRQAILQALAEQSRVVRLPLNRVGSIHKIGRAQSKLEQHHKRMPNAREIADELSVAVRAKEGKRVGM